MIGRLKDNGKLDARFASSGIRRSDLRFSSERAQAMTTGPHGRVVLAGIVPSKRGGGFDIVAARYRHGGKKADADADGVVDARDRCPGYYAGHRSGCPRVPRQIEITLARGDRLAGRLHASLGRCESEQKVTIVRRAHGRRDEYVGTARTASYGYWRFRGVRPGEQVYARAPRRLVRGSGRCTGTRSRVRTVNAGM